MCTYRHCQCLLVSGDGKIVWQAPYCESEGQGQRVSIVYRSYAPFVPCHIGQGTEGTPRIRDSHGIESVPGQGHSTTSLQRRVATVQQSKRGMGLPGQMRQRGSDTKVYLGSSSIMKYEASKVASAKGQDVSACKRLKCTRRTHDDSTERCLLMARLFKEWLSRDLFGAIQMRSQVFHDDGARPRHLCWLLDGP